MRVVFGLTEAVSTHLEYLIAEGETPKHHPGEAQWKTWYELELTEVNGQRERIGSVRIRGRERRRQGGGARKGCKSGRRVGSAIYKLRYGLGFRVTREAYKSRMKRKIGCLEDKTCHAPISNGAQTWPNCPLLLLILSMHRGASPDRSYLFFDHCSSNVLPRFESKG